MDDRDQYRVGCRLKPYRFTCWRCGRPFETKRRDAMFCGAACRKYANRSMHAKIEAEASKTASQDRSGSQKSDRSGVQEGGKSVAEVKKRSKQAGRKAKKKP